MMNGSTENNFNVATNMEAMQTQEPVTQYVDQFGNPIDPTLIDANGNYVGAPQAVQAPQAPQYVDEFGNPIDPSMIDANGNYIGAPQAPQYVDEFGNPIDPSLIDANGNYIGAPQTPQYVDEFGNPIDPSLIDANGNYIGDGSTLANSINEQDLAQELNAAAGNPAGTEEPTSAAVATAQKKELLSGMVTFDYNNVPITDIVNSIILDSINKGASDIHFDPFDEGIKIRLRIDGELNDYSIVPLYVKRNMITRIKIISGMNITESRAPQDGAIRTELQNKTIDLRVSCLPTNVGEKIVVRIMDYSMSAQGIEALDFSEENLEKVRRMLELPNGIILVTGATGSGKSTTVYSMLQRLNVEGTNLITVEDPIEMNIGGINQVQAQAEIGLTFAAVLRSILRQDPDVIMIGEIRDDETARIAVRASITGHLVLSTIHTNNSLNTIERLTDMSVERYLLGSSLSGIISQKLARRLCDKCKRLRPTSDYEKSIIKTTLGKDVDEIYEAVGCHECSRGYRGRIAVHEVLLLNQKIRDAITKGVPKSELRALVYSHHGTATMLEDGLGKVLEGKTSFEEVLKLIDLEDDLGTGTQLGLVNQIEASTFNNDDPNTNLLKTPEVYGPSAAAAVEAQAPVQQPEQAPAPVAPVQQIAPQELNTTANIQTAQLSGPINLNIPPELIASLEGLTSLKNIADELAKVTVNEKDDDDDDEDEEVEERIIKKKKKKPKKVIIEEIVEEDDEEPETIVRRISSKDIEHVVLEKDDDIGEKLFDEIDEIRENIPEVEEVQEQPQEITEPTPTEIVEEVIEENTETIEEQPTEEYVEETISEEQTPEITEQPEEVQEEINEQVQETYIEPTVIVEETQPEEQPQVLEEVHEVIEDVLDNPIIPEEEEQPTEPVETDQNRLIEDAFKELEDEFGPYDNEPVLIDLNDIDYLEGLVQPKPLVETKYITLEEEDMIDLENFNLISDEQPKEYNLDEDILADFGFIDLSDTEDAPVRETTDDTEFFDLEEPTSTEENFNLNDSEVDELLDVLEEE